MKMKFVTFIDYHGEQIIVFPDHIQHLQFARAVNSASFSDMEPISGGFVVDGECVGESISLGLSSRPQDTDLLKTFMGESARKIEAIDVNPVIHKKPTVANSSMTKNQRKRLNRRNK